MKSVKVFAGFALVLVFLLGGLSLAMAAVTAPLHYPEAPAELTVRRGTVELQRAGSTDWEVITGATAVTPDDSVRTAAESEASINLFDQGVLHIAPNSTLALHDFAWDPAAPETFTADIFLSAGDVWSRVFDFISPDSQFSVTTSSTVATVRGTTFWVGALPNDAARVYVDDHAVTVRSLVGSGVLNVEAGQQAQLEREGRRSALRFTEAPSGADLELIEKYRRWDLEYESEVIERQLAFAEAARRIDPESPVYNFQRFSERFRLAITFNDEREADLRARFMAGRVLDAYTEFAGRGDVTRAQILLRHAQEFGGEDIVARPEVRRAILFFGRDRTEVPEQLEDLIEDAEEEQATSQPFIDPVAGTGVHLDIQVTEPVVRGQSIESKAELRR
jgi:hypothetical protein